MRRRKCSRSSNPSPNTSAKPLSLGAFLRPVTCNRAVAAMAAIAAVAVIKTFFFLLLLLAAGCRIQPASKMENLQISWDGRGFITADSHRPFAVRGFNYDRDYRSRLLEDYWDREWQTVAMDFREMKRLGANAVRIHLQLGRFMNSPTEPNQHSLEQLGRLVRLAQSNRLYLDITGLGCYRKDEVPEWYSSLGESPRWA